MQQHTSAVEALAKTAPAFASKTFVVTTGGSTPATPYLVIHPSDGRDTQDRVSAPKTGQHPQFTLHVVGGTYSQVAAGVKQLKDRFVPNGRGVVFSIPGEKAFPLKWESPVPVQVDDDVNPPLLYQVVEVDFTTEPAP